MAKWPGGPCPGCAHSHGSTPCNVCGGGTGYPEHASPQLMDPCDTCIDSIGSTTETGGPLSSEVDPEAPTEVLDVLAISGQMNNFATTELTDPEAVDHILTLGDGLGPDEVPEYRTPPDVVPELVPRVASYRELWGQALTRLGLLDGIAPDEARNAAMDALRMITDRYRERAGS